MREKLIESLKDTRANAAWHHWGYEESADHLIANDVVPVVRCKDCKYWHEETEHFVICSVMEGFMKKDDFCSYGERKDDD